MFGGRHNGAFINFSLRISTFNITAVCLWWKWLQTPRGRKPEPVGIASDWRLLEAFGTFLRSKIKSSIPPSSLRTERGHLVENRYVHQVAHARSHGDAGTDDHSRTVKWVVLGKLRGQTLTRSKVKRPQQYDGTLRSSLLKRYSPL